VLHDENGKFVKGHPKVGGIQKGEKHKITVIGTIENMFENDPQMFLEFVDKYLKDPRNRQHIVEMIDGKPRGSETNVAVGIAFNQTPLTDEERAPLAYEVLARVHKLSIDEIKNKLGGV